MLLHRVAPVLPKARPGAPGHPSYVHLPQTAGRIDNPDYTTVYAAKSQAAAIGETFGNLPTWDRSMFPFAVVPGSVRCLITLHVPDEIKVCDLDDPATLARLGLRPTQVITRNRSVTQAWARRIWKETSSRGSQLWDGISWWSFHRPDWAIVATWIAPEVVNVEPLGMDHPALRDAANTLSKPCA